MNLRSLLIIGLLLIGCLEASLIKQETLQGISEDGIVVDLRNPVLQDGVLSTQQGGVVRAADLRIQAKNIRYIRSGSEVRLEADEEILLEYDDWIFAGERVEYDFQKRVGRIWGGRTRVGAWYVGGKFVELREDRSFSVKEGFLSTCESVSPEWQISSREIEVDPDRNVHARSIRFNLVQIPVLWFPLFSGNLDSFSKTPLRMHFGIGGHDRFFVSARYRFYSSGNWHNYLRLDYRQRRGFGGGLETEYYSKESATSLETRNYVAHDGSLFDLSQSTRYRLQGRLRSDFGENDNYSLRMTWDKMSDQDMPSDYAPGDFDLLTAERTELRIRRASADSITNLRARARVNFFQTVKQHLPSVEARLRPLTLGSTGILIDQRIAFGYLDFKFANDLVMTKDFNALRGEYNPRLSRPFRLGHLTVVPESELVGVFYNNSPSGDTRLLATAKVGATLRTHLYRRDGHSLSTLSPYLRGDFWNRPTSLPDDHFIFDQDDGYSKLSHVEPGIDYQHFSQGRRVFFGRGWIDYFPGIGTFEKQLRSLTAFGSWSPTPRFTCLSEASLDIPRSDLGTFNIRGEWTLGDDVAIATEYRHRNAFTWRKADRRRLMMEAFVPEAELRASALSDRRDSIGLHVFCRLSPWLAVEGRSRHGWNRSTEPAYNEFEVKIHTLLQSTWELTCSYTRREHDERFGIQVRLRENTPRRKHFIPKDPLRTKLSD